MNQKRAGSELILGTNNQGHTYSYYALLSDEVTYNDQLGCLVSYTSDLAGGRYSGIYFCKKETGVDKMTANDFFMFIEDWIQTPNTSVQLIDNELLAIYVQLLHSYPDNWDANYTHSHLESWLTKKELDGSAYHFINQYQDFCQSVGKENKFIADYICDTFGKDVFNRLKSVIEDRLQRLYRSKLHHSYVKVDKLAELGMVLVNNKLPWYQLLDDTIYSNQYKPYDWNKVDIMTVIIYYLVGIYVRNYSNINTPDWYSQGFAPIKLTTGQRKELWEWYIKEQRYRIYQSLDVEEERTEAPTEDEIKLAVYKENQDRLKYVKEFNVADTFTRLAYVYANQFMSYARGDCSTSIQKSTNMHAPIYYCDFINQNNGLHTADEIDQELQEETKKDARSLCDYLKTAIIYNKINVAGMSTKHIYDELNRVYKLRYHYPNFVKYYLADKREHS